MTYNRFLRVFFFVGDAVDPKVYISGAVDDADHMVADGRAKVDDFKFFLHLCGWAPGQLQAEIDRGVWFPAATSTNVSPPP